MHTRMDIMGLVLADNIQARERFVREFPCLDSQGARAAMWEIGRDDGMVLSVIHDDAALFPAFQFRNAAVLDAVIEVVNLFGGRFSEWQIAFWFVSSCRWLDGGRPMDRLNDPASVVEAARSEIEDVLG